MLLFIVIYISRILCVVKVEKISVVIRENSICVTLVYIEGSITNTETYTYNDHKLLILIVLWLKN